MRLFRSLGISLGIFVLAAAFSACGGGGGSGAAPIPVAASASGTNAGVATISSASGSIVLSSVANTVKGTIVPGTSSVTVAALSTAEVADATTLALESMGISLDGTATQSHSLAPLGFPGSASPAAVTPVERFPAEDGAAISATLARFDHSDAPLISTRVAQSLPSTVGATASLWIAEGALNTTATTYVQVPATLAAVTAHGYIWIDQTLSSVLGSSSAIATIGNDFENAYASDTSHFGTTGYTTSAPGYTAYGSVKACDASGNQIGSTPLYIEDSDPHIAVFVVNVGSLGAGVGGYFGAANFWTTAAANCTLGSANPVRTNGAPMIYVGYDPSLGAGFPAAYELDEDLVRGTAHELQHLINFVHHVILANVPAEDRWINEGLSMLAQDLAVPRMFGTSNDVDDAVKRASIYLGAPQNYSVTGFSGIDTTQNGGTGALEYNCPDCYGVEYLFERYLYDRFGGDAYAQTMESGGKVSYANIAAATGTDVPTLLAQFGIALLTSNTGLSTDPAYNFAGLNLEGTLKDQFGGTVVLNGPSAANALAPGGSYNVGEYPGTYLYLTVGGIGSNGATVTITDPAGRFGLRGALVHH